MRAFDQQFANVYNDIAQYPSLPHVAEALGCSVKTVRNRAGEMRSMSHMIDVPELVSRVGTGRELAPIALAPQDIDEDAPVFRKRDLIKPTRMPARSRGTRYFILTSAQDESMVHQSFLDNLQVYADWLGDCQIMIAGFTYNKSVFDDHAGRKSGKKTNPIHFHQAVQPFMTSNQVELGDGIVFCGEMNTLPTATMPLSGFETYTRDKWVSSPIPRSSCSRSLRLRWLAPKFS